MKTAAEHLRELEPAIKKTASFAEFCAALRRHKQREYLRIGARDLMASVTMEETVRELTALAEASLDAAYRFCRAEVEKDYGALNRAGNRESPIASSFSAWASWAAASSISAPMSTSSFSTRTTKGKAAAAAKAKSAPREFFSAIGKKIIHAMGDVTEDGFRLSHRPEASSARRQRPVGAVRRLGDALL